MKLKLHHINFCTANVEAMDVDLPFRHYATTEAQLANSDKPLFIYSRGTPQVRDSFEMVRIARGLDATAQIAGGVPAMCDGVTQGQPGMDLSLFSRDVIAMATAVSLSHNVFDAAIMLGVCDKIVPGLFIGAARFGHLPVLFLPAGPMASGISNDEKARVRQLHAEGKAGRDELLAAESASYHSPGTCTFYGTANSNQMMMEVMGLHLPGAAFERRQQFAQAPAALCRLHRLVDGLLAAVRELVDRNRVVRERKNQRQRHHRKADHQQLGKRIGLQETHGSGRTRAQHATAPHATGNDGRTQDCASLFLVSRTLIRPSMPERLISVLNVPR